MTLTFIQTMKDRKSVNKNGLVRLHFGDTHQTKNDLNTLKIENIDGAVKQTKTHNTDIISINLLSFFSGKL